MTKCTLKKSVDIVFFLILILYVIFILERIEGYITQFIFKRYLEGKENKSSNNAINIFYVMFIIFSPSLPIAHFVQILSVEKRLEKI